MRRVAIAMLLKSGTTIGELNALSDEVHALVARLRFVSLVTLTEENDDATGFRPIAKTRPIKVRRRLRAG